MLQPLSREAGGTIGWFAQRAPHGEQIVAGRNHRDVLNLPGVHRIRVIADMDQGRRGFQSAPQSPRKEDEFVDVGQPFRHEAASRLKTPEERLRLDQFRGNARSGQAIQHHQGEALHALLAIGGVVTDQQNHCFDDVESRDHACDRHKANGAPRFARSRLCSLQGQQSRSHFRYQYFAPLERDRS